MSGRLRVVLVHSYYRERGGEGVVFENERDLLRSHGHKVYSFVRHNSALTDFPVHKAARLTVWNGCAERRLRALIQESGADVVHFHNTFPYISPAAVRGAHAAGVAVVATLHNYRLMCPAGTMLLNGRQCSKCTNTLGIANAVTHGCYRDSRLASLAASSSTLVHRLTGTWSKHVHRFIAISEHVASRHEAHGFFQGRMSVKPNFVVPDPGPGRGDGDFVLYVGRLTPEKGVRTVLEAAPSILPSCTVRIVGKGPLNEEVARAANEHPRLLWRDEIPHRDVLDLMGQAKVVLVPSLWEEPFGRTVIEAFSRGTPVIATDGGAIPEMVRDGQNGFLVPPGDPSALAEAVRRFVDFDVDIQSFRESARRTYLERFGPRTAYQDLMQVYTEALAVRDGKAPPTWERVS